MYIQIFELCHLVPRLLSHRVCRLGFFAVNNICLDHAEVGQEKHWVDTLTTAFNVLQYLKTPVWLELTYILLQEKIVETQVVVPFRLEMQDIKRGQDLIRFENIRLLSERDKQRVDNHGSQQNINHEVNEAEQLEDADRDEFALEPIRDGAVISQDPWFDAADKFIWEGGEAKVIAQVRAR